MVRHNWYCSAGPMCQLPGPKACWLGGKAFNARITVRQEFSHELRDAGVKNVVFTPEVVVKGNDRDSPSSDLKNRQPGDLVAAGGGHG